MADTDPDALELRIERTRADLARTVDEIADRVSPKRVAGRNVAKVKAQAEHVVAAIGDLVGGRENGLARRNGSAPAFTAEGDGWEDDEAPPKIAPILIGVGAALAVGAVIVLLRRRRK